MLNNKERWVHHYSIGVQSLPLDAPAYNLVDCLVAMKTVADRHECAMLSNKNTACIRLVEIKFSKEMDKAALLFTYADRNVSDPAFSNLVSGKIRSEPKLDGEGIAVSAHALIYFSTDKKRPHEHRLLLEDVPGIGKTKIVPFLNRFFKSLMTRSFIDPADRKEKACYPSAFMESHASQTLKDDLERGKLSFITLTRNVILKEFDQEPFLAKTTQSISVKVTRPYSDPESLGLINRLKLKYAAEGYEDIRVVVNYPQGKQKTIPLNNAREDAGDCLMGRMDFITSHQELAQCASSLNKEFMDILREIDIK